MAKIMNKIPPYSPRQTIRRGPVERTVAGIGRLGQPNVSDEAAAKYGKRRVIAMLAPITAVALLYAGNESNNGAEKQTNKIEACAAAIVGHEVNLGTRPGTGEQMVPADVYDEVMACEVTDGNVEQAKDRLAESGNISGIQP